MVVNYKACLTNTLLTIILDSVFVMSNITVLENTSSYTANGTALCKALEILPNSRIISNITEILCGKTAPGLFMRYSVLNLHLYFFAPI